MRVRMTREAMHKFIIFTPSYDERGGGSIALHQLASLLQEAGREARLWPAGKPVARGEGVWPALKWHLKDWIKRVFFKEGFRFAPGGSVRLARGSEIDDAVVVYPEVVEGNPLQARRVVRWLLHKPGYLTGKIGFGANELHFYYQKAFEFNFEGAQSGGELFLIKIFSDIYRNENRKDRSGRCYVLRKGADRAEGVDLSDGIVVDNLGHRETAKVFNQVEYCISYDPHTFYSVYAAMCGCKSIIVPVDGVSKEQWQPIEEFRDGLAYGEGDVEHARLTLPKLLALWSTKEADNKEAVRKFIAKCDEYFD